MRTYLLFVDVVVGHLGLDLHDLVLLLGQVGHLVEDEPLLLVVAGVDEMLRLLIFYGVHGMSSSNISGEGCRSVKEYSCSSFCRCTLSRSVSIPNSELRVYYLIIQNYQCSSALGEAYQLYQNRGMSSISFVECDKLYQRFSAEFSKPNIDLSTLPA